MPVCKLPSMNKTINVITFLGDIIDFETGEKTQDQQTYRRTTTYEYEKDEETHEWMTYDRETHYVLFEKGYTFCEDTLKAQGYPLEKWISDGICERITAYEPDETSPRPWETLDNLEQEIQPHQYMEISENGTYKKVLLPRLAGNIAFHLYDDETTTGVNRGFLVTSDMPIIYRYNGGYYQDDGESYIRSMSQKILKNRVRNEYKNEIVNWFRDNPDLRVDRSIFDSHPEIIVLENCKYNLRSGMTDTPWIDDFATTYFPITYDEDATCPQWIDFLEQVLYKDDILVMQELFGYCFWKPYTFQKAFMMVGTGANGKSVTLYVLSTMLGEHNISSAPLQRLCKERFIAYGLINKYANICGDLSDAELKDVGMFKTLVGGDLINAERKHVQGMIQFRNTAKGIFSCNIVPECKDTSFAYKRRWVVFEYPNVFVEGTPDCDPNIKYKLAKEIPGIFNWSMEGLRRLLKNGTFSPHRTLDDVQQFMKTEQDPVNQFCRACIKEGVHEDVYGKTPLYGHYLDYCALMGFPTIAQRQFTMKMKQYGPRTMTEGQTRSLGKCWHGLIYTGPEKEKDDGKVKPLDVTYEVVSDDATDIGEKDILNDDERENDEIDGEGLIE